MRVKISLLLLVLPLLIFSNTLNFSIATNSKKSLKRISPNIKPNTPMIDVYHARILLPAGEDFDNINLTFKNQITSKKNVKFASQQIPTSIDKQDFTGNNSQNLSGIYPKISHKTFGIQIKNGYAILPIDIYFQKYDIDSKKLLSYQSIDFQIITKKSRDLKNKEILTISHSQKIKSYLNSFILNPEEIDSYASLISQNNFRNLPDASNPYKMIIITNQETVPFFNNFIEWKNAQNITTGIFTTEDIYENYEGVDNPEKIRNFILDAYQTYNNSDTNLEYVLLGGDDEIVPIRGAVGNVGETHDYHIPCDLYYSCLDGNWNENGNNLWGEISDNPDLLPEVSIGRIPAQTQAEFNNYFHKEYHYVDDTTYSQNIVYLLGENLNNNPLTWGGDYKDVVEPSIPDSYHKYKLYNRIGNYSPEAVYNVINQGLGVINHMGHANYNYLFGLNPSSPMTMTNTEYGIAYSQGCYPAAFDQATSGDAESVAENFVFQPAGLLAFIGNTRYGWYMPGNTNGASEFFDVKYFEALFPQNIRQLGKALNYSKVELLNETLDNSVFRWVYYEMVLFGDPSMELKSADPSFPMVKPESMVFDDFSGDNDGAINPGEEINIIYNLNNEEGWNDAQDVYGIITIESPEIETIVDSVFFGNITAGTTIDNSENPFQINVPANCPFGDYDISLRIHSSVSENTFFDRTYQSSLHVTLNQTNWPWNSSYAISTAQGFFDTNNDGIKDLVTVDTNGNPHVLNKNAEIIQESNTLNENIWKSTSFADFDGDDIPEVVIASRTGKIIIEKLNGDILSEYDTGNPQLVTPIIGDFNGDGSLEIASIGLDHKLNVVDSNCNPANNFPISFDGLINHEIACADLNNDGKREIIMGSSTGELSAINSNGSNITGFPINLNSPIVSGITILDNKDIVVSTDDETLYLISPNGAILVSTQLEGKIAGSAIVADFNNDQIQDIALIDILGNQYIFDRNLNSLSGWPIATNTFFTNPPLAVDIDNDGQIDLVSFSSQSNLFAFHNDGTPLGFSPYTISIINNTPGLIVDIDGDSDFDAICGNSFGISVVDIPYNKGTAVPWFQYRGNLRRTGFSGDNVITENDSHNVNSPKNTLYQNYPNPFNPTTTISFNISKESNVELAIYNIKGQKVKMLINNKLAKGTHQIIWNGKDKKNKHVSSGIYFYRLKTGNFTSTKKMILLK